MSAKVPAKTFWQTLKPFLLKLMIFLSVTSMSLGLYIYHYYWFNSDCNWAHKDSVIKLMAFGDPQIRTAGANASFRTKVDIMGNDRYLAHVYKVMTSTFNPSHIAVMGDLFSSQWITDSDFYERSKRYSEIIFRPDIIPQETQFFNICGNHDIGYAGEITDERLNRFLKVFGKVNFVKEYDEGYRIVVLNSLAIDGPLWDHKYQTETLEFLDSLKSNEYDGPTILLTHVPLYKPKGICMDGPYFTFYDSQFKNVLREQNHLTEASSSLVLEKVFNPDYDGIIVTGHDHEGCLSQYTFNKSSQLGFEVEKINGTSIKSRKGDKTPRIVEATVRSMMGEFGGNTGLISGSKNEDGSWEFEYSLCPFHVQHLWWFTNVLFCISLSFIPIYILFF